jgi:hypothetical protein
MFMFACSPNLMPYACFRGVLLINKAFLVKLDKPYASSYDFFLLVLYNK